MVNVNRHSQCTGWMPLPVIIRLATVELSGVAFATLAACLWVILGRPVAKKLTWKRQKRADFVRFATAALSSQSTPANYDTMRLLGLHIACQYGVHINIACIIRSLVCCCCYDLKFTLAEYFKPTIEDIFHVFFFFFFFFFKKENEESISPSQTKQ